MDVSSRNSNSSYSHINNLPDYNKVNKRKLSYQSKIPSKKLKTDQSLTEKNQNPIKSLSEESRAKALSNYLNTVDSINKFFQITLSEDQISDVNKLAEIVFGLVKTRLRSPDVLTEKEIRNIYDILFNSSLKDTSNFQLQFNNRINPSIPYIFYNLFSCLENIDSYPSCEESLKLLNTKPNQAYQFIQQISLFKIANPDTPLSEKLKNTLKTCFKLVEDWESRIKTFPLVLTKDFFKSNNHQETYVINNKNGDTLFIFKPDYQNFIINETNQDTAIFEHTASLIAEIATIPVPKTIYIQYKNWTGSAQVFIENAKTINEINCDAVSQIELQKIIIFDILFANTDRHSNNILFDKEQPFAIDHDLCFLREIRPELRLEYLECVHKNSFFLVELLDIISNKKLEKYIEIMQTHSEIDQGAVDWMILAAKNLNELIIKNTPVIQSIEEMQKLWFNYASKIN